MINKEKWCMYIYEIRIEREETLMFGLRWLCHLSRHCFPILPGSNFAICDHFLSPNWFTNSTRALKNHILNFIKYSRLFFTIRKDLEMKLIKGKLKSTQIA